MDASPDKQSDGIVRGCSGHITADGTAVTLELGFNPQHVIVINETDAIRWELIAGMAATKTTKLTGTPTFAVDTGSAIVLNGDGTVTLSATLAANGKSLVWFAQ